MTTVCSTSRATPVTVSPWFLAEMKLAVKTPTEPLGRDNPTLDVKALVPTAAVVEVVDGQAPDDAAGPPEPCLPFVIEPEARPASSPTPQEHTRRINSNFDGYRLLHRKFHQIQLRTLMQF